MKIQHTKTASFALLGVLTASALGGVFVPAAQAKSSKKWNTAAIVGGAVAGYGLLRHNKTATIGGAALGGYSLYRASKDRSAEKKRSRLYYQHRYGRAWRNHYNG